MTLLLKDPQAALDYAVDWGSEYLSGDTIAVSAWEVSPAEEGGVTVLASTFDTLVATVTAGGGVAGHVYRLTNNVVLESGRVDRRSIMLRVEAR